MVTGLMLEPLQIQIPVTSYIDLIQRSNSVATAGVAVRRLKVHSNYSNRSYHEYPQPTRTATPNL